MDALDVKKKIPIIFQKLNNYEVDDTRFIKVKIWLMHLEENLNGSYFSKEVVNDAIYSLANTPILAYIEDNSDDEKDASDHRVVLVNEDGQLKVKYIGQAVGLIPETNNAKFEMRVCDDGVEREFLTVEGLLWTKFDDPIEIMLRDENKAESMEIHENYTGKFEEDNLFHFSSFQFFGACILGKDISPAMLNASIELQFSYKDFEKEINEKTEQFKRFSKNQSSDLDVDIKSKNTQEGGNNILNEKLALLEKYNLTKETISFSIEELTLEEIENKIRDQFSLSNNQLITEINKILQNMTEVRENYWGELVERRSYYFIDLKDGNAIVATYDWDTYYGVPYTENGDIVTLDMDAKVEYIPDWRVKQEGDSTTSFAKIKEIIVSEFSTKKEELETQINEIAEKFSALEITQKEVQEKLDTTLADYSKLNTEFETIKNDNELLSEFRANVEQAQKEAFEAQQKELKSELIENFSKVLTQEEIKSVEDKNLSLDEMEKEYKLMYASKELSTKFSKKPRKQETEIPILNFSKKKNDDWTSCIKKQ